jgi:hypothetical protein
MSSVTPLSSPIILTLVQKLRESPRARLSLASASAFAALALIYRFYFSKESRYVSDHSKVGRLASSTHEAERYYDVIIVGGGWQKAISSTKLPDHLQFRHFWLCFVI